MIDKATIDQEWRAFLKRGRKYFMLRQELEALAEKGRLREAARRVRK